MLTDDENIVDVMFNVQYRIKQGNGAEEFLFRTRDPMGAVVQTAESAMREVVGRKKMDSVLFESKQEIAEEVKKLMQEMLDATTPAFRFCLLLFRTLSRQNKFRLPSTMPLRPARIANARLMKARLMQTTLCLRHAVWLNVFARKLKHTNLVLSLRQRVTQTASIRSTHSMRKLRR